MQYKKFSGSLVTLVHDTKRNVDPICAKIELMQHIYLQKHSDLYRLSEVLWGNPAKPQTTEKFYSSLKRSNIDRAVTDVSEVDGYFQTKVFAESSKDWFAPENWGALIKSLRDKISHRDIIKRNFESEETLLDAVMFDWPTLRGMTYDRFCQYMENGMFTMLTNVSSIIYGLEWIPGAYNSDMYNTTHSVKG